MLEETEVKTIGNHFNMKTTISFIGGIIIGVLFAVPLVEKEILGTDLIANIIQKKVDTEQESAAETVGMSPSGAPVSSVASRTGEHTLVAADQPAGNVVVISMVAIAQSGWVAIHEETTEGGIGNILGARRFMEGKYFGSAIDLLRETEGGKTYYAALHEDDGDNVFNFETEVPAQDAGGELIQTKFMTQPSL